MSILWYISTMAAALLSDIRLFLILLLLSACMILTDNLHLLDLPKSTLQKLTIPIQYGFYQNSLQATRQIEFILLAREAAQKNQALREQLAQILSENAKLRRELALAEGFLAQQKTLSPQTFNLVAARPIGISRYLLIDKGSDDGIKINQIVIYKDNYIGRVKETSVKKSQVLLSSDPDSRIAAFSANQGGKARGVLVGQFGQEIILDKILHQEPITKGDLVYSEGSELEIPRGLILGQVSEVVDEDNQIFKQAKVHAIFDVTNLDLVFVITN